MKRSETIPKRSPFKEDRETQGVGSETFNTEDGPDKVSGHYIVLSIITIRISDSWKISNFFRNQKKWSFNDLLGSNVFQVKILRVMVVV